MIPAFIPSYNKWIDLEPFLKDVKDVPELRDTVGYLRNDLKDNHVLIDKANNQLAFMAGEITQLKITINQLQTQLLYKVR